MKKQFHIFVSGLLCTVLAACGSPQAAGTDKTDSAAPSETEAAQAQPGAPEVVTGDQISVKI